MNTLHLSPAVSSASILRLPQVKQRVGLSRTTIYRAVKEGTFPAPIKLGGPRAVGWTSTSIEAWIAALQQGEAA